MMDNDDLLPKKREKETDSIFVEMVMDNDDLLTEILLRLPGKALIRFTSVSKKWRSIISSNDFRHNHTLRRPKPPPSSLLIQTDYGAALIYLNHTIKGENKAIPYTLPLPLAGDRHYRIRNACNGLLLLESIIRPKAIQFKDDDLLHHLLNNTHYYVLNPTTKQSNKITLPRTDDNPYVESLTLAFDPLKSPYYKIVCVTADSWNESSPTTYWIHVYDSEFHEWELKLGPFAYPHESFIYRGVPWNDAVYWSRSSSSTCYDLVKNEIKTLPWPPILLVYDELQEFDGRLYHFVPNEDFYRLYLRNKGFAVEEWELGGDRKWESKRHLHIPAYPLDHDDYCTGIMRFMGGGGGGEGEGPTYCLMTYYLGAMRAYSFLEDEYEDVVFPDLPHRCSNYKWGYAEAFLFGEVLAPVSPVDH